MEVFKIIQLEHSGHGENAIHKKVLKEFKVSYENGLDYCRKNGYRVLKTDTLLRVRGEGEYAFKMDALINEPKQQEPEPENRWKSYAEALERWIENNHYDLRSMEASMTRPNRPGYYRANND